MEVSIERTDCISCGLCAAACPEVFAFAPDGRAQVQRQPQSHTEEAQAQAAADGCPVSIIYLESNPTPADSPV